MVQPSLTVTSHHQNLGASHFTLAPLASYWPFHMVPWLSPHPFPMSRSAGHRAVGALPRLRGAAAVHGRHILGLADGMGRRITAARRVKPVERRGF